MRFNALLCAAVLAVLSGTAVQAQSVAAAAPAEAAAPAPDATAPAPVANPAAAAGVEADKPKQKAAAQRPDNEALLRAQAAGYKLVNKDGKEVFCKKQMVTGSRLATSTRCLTLAQIEAERNATKDMLLDMSRKSINVPQE